MKYITPADVEVSDDRAAHIARGSAEPGTDYMTAYGTDLRMPADGVISYVDYSNAAPGGRRVRITCGDEWIDLIHLASVSGRVGDRVTSGQTGVCLSGASGFGRDRYYGPHVHVTRRRVGAPYRDTLDFQTVAGNPTTAGKPSAPLTKKRRVPMNYLRITGKAGERRGGTYVVFAADDGSYVAEFVGDSGPNNLVELQDEGQIGRLQAIIRGLR